MLPCQVLSSDAVSLAAYLVEFEEFDSFQGCIAVRLSMYIITVVCASCTVRSTASTRYRKKHQTEKEGFEPSRRY